MIRMIQSTSSGQAKDYFSDALVKSDYYMNDQEMNGEFRGKLAARLNLGGMADKQAFFDLCENRHPATGKPLTPRTNDERTVGYDLNFHVPKSVSVVHMLSGDDHVLKVFQQCVHETMTDIEADTQTRVRKGKKYEDRATGEMIYVDFVHQTARPVDGSEPDPHLHAHCYVFNATWDGQEQRIKAGQFRNIKRDMPYYQALFHKRLSDRLTDLGYGVRQTGKSFEIAGVPQQVIDLFSKRTDEIGKAAQERGIMDAKALDELGARTRSGKQKGASMDELKASWRKQIAALGLSDKEGEMPIRFGVNKDRAQLTAEQCIDHALDHAFERASVMPYRRLMATALKHSIGNSGISATEISQRMDADPRLLRIDENGQLMCTTRAVLREEQVMVSLAKDGIGKLRPIYDYEPDVALKGQQREAVRHILTTRDQVSIVRGAAGAGKTTLMREAVDWMERKGKSVTVLAPTANASRGVLRQEGFKDAETVALFLADKSRQQKIKDGVLWVDEAGLLGTRDMTDLLDIVRKHNAQLVLGGDTRQHASVVRGDALRILNTVGGIKTAEVNKIFRQKNLAYRAAVEDLASGNIGKGFERLDDIGAIKTVDRLKPNETLVQDYLKAMKAGKTGLIISPTHSQGEAVTAAIRQAMRKAEMLGKKQIKADRLDNLNLTEAQKRDWRNYKPGQIVQFNQNAPGIQRGSQWQIKEVTHKEVVISDGQRNTTLPKARSGSFDLLEKSSIELSKGDTIRITRNGFDKEDKRLDNGIVLQVQSVTKAGKVKLHNPASGHTFLIDKDHGHIAHAHCITSYASQGKTVDEVFIAQPAATFPATDAKQFYVSVSRAREKVSIYTDDKAALLEHASKAGDRRGAMELVGSGRQKHLDHVHQLAREGYGVDHELSKDRNGPSFTCGSSRRAEIDRDYEPGL